MWVNKKTVSIETVLFLHGANDGTRTHGITEPQSAELTNFSTSAICFIILLYFCNFYNHKYNYLSSFVVFEYKLDLFVSKNEMIEDNIK